jgi:hypothetical protein
MSLSFLLMLRFGRIVAKAIVTLRALALTPGMSRILSRWVRSRSYSEREFLRADGAGERADGAGEQWMEARREALDALADLLRSQATKSIAWGSRLRESFSDLRFTDANRVPFPFMRVMREKFPLSSVMIRSTGPHLIDLDGRLTLDISGSYGLNVAGFERYKQWIANGWDRKRLGIGERPWPCAWPASSADRPKYRAAQIYFKIGRSLLSYERDRGSYGGGSAGPIQYAQIVGCLFFRRLSRLVGRCTAWTGQ